MRKSRSTSGRWRSNAVPRPRRSDGCKWRWRARPIGPRRTRSWAWRSSCRAILKLPFRISSAPASLDPASASAHLNLAVLYAELGRFAEARSLATDGASPRPRRAARGGPSQSPPEVTSSVPDFIRSEPSKPPARGRVPLYHSLDR